MVIQKVLRLAYARRKTLLSQVSLRLSTGGAEPSRDAFSLFLGKILAKLVMCHEPDGLTEILRRAVVEIRSSVCDISKGWDLEDHPVRLLLSEVKLALISLIGPWIDCAELHEELTAEELTTVTATATCRHEILESLLLLVREDRLLPT